MENDDVSNSNDDIAIHFQKGDVQLMIDALSLMGATLLGTHSGKGARERLQHLLDQFERLSPLPGYHGSYGDSARFMYACQSVKSCDQWEVILNHDRGSVFNSVQISIETVKDGQKSVFNLTSELQMGLRAEKQDAMGTYGVYMSRLVEMCQELAPINAVHIALEKLRFAVDTRRFSYDTSKDCDEAARQIGERLEFSISVRDFQRVMREEGDGLPSRTSYVDVMVAAPLGTHASIRHVLDELTEEVLRPAPVNGI